MNNHHPVQVVTLLAAVGFLLVGLARFSPGRSFGGLGFVPGITSR